MNIRRKFQNKFQQKQNIPNTISGLLGNSNGVVNVPSRNNYVYVRLAGTGTAEVFNSRVTAIYDLPVICGYDPIDPGKFQVLSIRGSTVDYVGGAFGSGSGYAPASRYRWLYPGGGQDPLFVETRQLMPLRITPTGGLNFRVESQIIWTGTAWKIFGGSTETNLTSLVPTTADKCCMVLITIDGNGNVKTTKGDEVAISALDISNMPAPPSGTRSILGAIRLYYGQTVIQEARTNTDVPDLRFSTWSSGGETSEHDAVKIGGIVVNLLDLQNGDILTYNTGGGESIFDSSLLAVTSSATTSLLFDGNKINQWVSSDQNAVHWVNFNFPYSAYISKIVITADSGDWIWADYPDDIYIYGSHIGDFSGEEYLLDHNTPGGEGITTRTFAEPRTAYRYYRITFGRANHACRMNEIEIYTVPETHRFQNQALVHDATKIDGITVDLTGISDGDALVYDLANTKIKPGAGGGSGDVVGPASSTDGHLAVFDGVDGKKIKDGGAIPTGASLTVEEADGTPSVADVIKIKVTNGSLTDDGSGVVSLDFGSAATDGAAIHDNEANEISAITEKTTPANDDLLLIEDSDASYVKKKLKISNLPSGSSGGTDVLMVQVFS